MSNGIIRVVRRGSVTVDGHKYIADELNELDGRSVRISINVKTVTEILIYTLNDKFICKAKMKNIGDLNGKE